jgi:hypothetical protein
LFVWWARENEVVSDHTSLARNGGDKRSDAEEDGGGTHVDVVDVLEWWEVDVVANAVVIDGCWGWSKVIRWLGGERENKVELFWNRVFVGGRSGGLGEQKV